MLKASFYLHHQEHQHTWTGIIKRNDHTFVKARMQGTEVRRAPSMRDLWIVPPRLRSSAPKPQPLQSSEIESTFPRRTHWKYKYTSPHHCCFFGHTCCVHRLNWLIVILAMMLKTSFYLHHQEHLHTATGIIKRNDHTFVKARKLESKELTLEELHRCVICG